MGKGKVEGCASCCKWLLIIFNVLFCLIGIAMIAAGVYAYIQLRSYLALFENQNINAPAIVLIAFGVITFIIAAIGCIGACKESACLLFTFAGIIAFVLIAEVVTGIVAIVYRSKIREWVENNSETIFKNYGKTDQDGKKNAVTDAVDYVQEKFDCCGIDAPTDWEKHSITKPASCREDPKNDTSPYWTKGCIDGIYDAAERNIYLVGGIGIGLGLLQILGIAFACCVGCAARKGEYA